MLKNAAKTKRVPAAEVLTALAAIKNAKVDPSTFLDTLGGSESPGRTWMLIFTAQVSFFLQTLCPSHFTSNAKCLPSVKLQSFIIFLVFSPFWSLFTPFTPLLWF